MDAPKITVPIHTDEHGRIMIDGTRIPIDTVIACYHHGETPAEIHEGFPTLRLPLIYSLISYYLDNQAELDAYLRQREIDAEQSRRELEAKNPDLFSLERKFREILAKQGK